MKKLLMLAFVFVFAGFSGLYSQTKVIKGMVTSPPGGGDPSP
ncbi:MAG TPA: hypothetical protein PK106_09360 [Bacteroidales bacterium]|nr:hypothetical protein [Bacteroidales bacterium]